MARRPSTARGRPAVLLALIAGALLLASCGGTSEREKVERFIEDVNSVNARAAPALRRTNAAYQRFAAGELSAPEAAAATEQSERLIASVRADVEELDPPDAARRLKELVLRVFDADARVADQTALTARYLVDQRRALAGLRGLSRDLRAALRDTDAGPEGQARALARYARGLDRVLARVRRLRAPLIFEPEQRAEIGRLVGSRAIALRLRSAILRRDPDAVVRLLDRLEEVNKAGVRPGLSRAAARRYNELLRRISRVQGEVQQEAGRLERTLE